MQSVGVGIPCIMQSYSKFGCNSSPSSAISMSPYLQDPGDLNLKSEVLTGFILWLMGFLIEGLAFRAYTNPTCASSLERRAGDVGPPAGEADACFQAFKKTAIETSVREEWFGAESSGLAALEPSCFLGGFGLHF